jgi:hypothetical protein
MCPNCFSSIAIALGGAGSAALPSLLLGSILAAAGLRFRTAVAPQPIQFNPEESAP